MCGFCNPISLITWHVIDRAQCLQRNHGSEYEIIKTNSGYTQSKWSFMDTQSEFLIKIYFGHNVLWPCLLNANAFGKTKQKQNKTKTNKQKKTRKSETLKRHTVIRIHVHDESYYLAVLCDYINTFLRFDDVTYLNKVLVERVKL